MPAQQELAAFALGFVPPNPNNTNATQILNNSTSGSAIGVAFSFKVDSARTLSEVSWYVSNTTAGLAAGDLQCDVYNDDGTGKPSVPGGSLGTITIGSPPGVGFTGWLRFTGFSVALTAGSLYWCVIRNNSGSASTANVTIQLGSTNTAPMVANGGNSQTWGTVRRVTTNGWTNPSWNTANALTSGFRVGFADGSYNGLPHQGIVDSTPKAYNDGTTNNEFGVSFTNFPTQISIGGAAFWTYCSSTSAGSAFFRLYQGTSTTPIRQTYSIPATNAASSPGWYEMPWTAGPVTLQPGTPYRLTIGSTGGNASNYWNARFAQYNWDNTLPSLGLLPFDGTMLGTTLVGTTWTDASPPWIVPCALILDTTGEFPPSSGGNVFWIEG
jgi:hypothetical protein